MSAPSFQRTAPCWQGAPLDEATAWIRQQARAEGFGQVVRIEPEKLTSRSVVLKVVTSSERLFFKSGCGVVRREAPLTAFLWRTYPAHFPSVVAFDVSQDWMLMREVRGPTLMSIAHAGSWQRALETLGRIQCGFSDAIDALFELGCRQRTAASLAGEVDAFVERWCAEPDTTGDDCRRLVAAAPIWKRLCARTIPGLPDATLDHIDLHPRNVVITRGGPVFLDWDGGAIGHPFWSPLILLGYVERLLPHVAVRIGELRSAYLRPWTTCLPMPELADAFEHMRPLASLKYAFGLSRLLKTDDTTDEADNLRTSIRVCLETALSITR